MKIDRIHIQNFKWFKDQSFELSPGLTLLIGNNGSGKTSVLDALAVALGIWHKAAPNSGWRPIFREEIRLEPSLEGDRVLFKTLHEATAITAFGSIGGRAGLKWTREIKARGAKTTNRNAKEAESAIAALVAAAEAHHDLLPVLAYYGAGRAWLPTNKRTARPLSSAKTQRFDAYNKCLEPRINDHYLNEWFLYETVAANGSGLGRPGFQAVKEAIKGCIPDADQVRYDADLKQIVLKIDGWEQPYYNLSAGQRMMLAMVADIAIKAVTLNSYLLGPDQPGASDAKAVLELSPGVVLIDELDVHLHPSWQRRVASDLQRIFPKIQFITTSHSPQVIGEIPRDNVLQLAATQGEQVTHPRVSRGADANWILDHVMTGASSLSREAQDPRDEAELALSEGRFDEAREALSRLRSLQQGDTGDLVRLESELDALEAMA